MWLVTFKKRTGGIYVSRSAVLDSTLLPAAGLIRTHSRRFIQPREFDKTAEFAVQ